MKLVSGMLFSLAASHAFAQPVNPPFYGQPVETFAGKVEARNLTRLKLTVTGTESSAVSSVRVGNVSVCSAKACYRPTVPDYVNLQDTQDGAAALVADFVIPVDELKSVYFETPTGNLKIAGSIQLSNSVKLDPEFSGEEILITLDKRTVNGDTIFVPHGSASLPLGNVGTAIHYDPRFKTSATLSNGASVVIPAGATDAPYIFNIAVHDTGGAYPLVDIYPVVNLLTPAKVTVKRVAHPQLESISAGAPAPAPTPKSASPAGRQSIQSDSVAPDEKSFEIRGTGVLRGDKTSQGTFSEKAVAQTAPGGWTNCAADLSFPQNQSIISSGLNATGTEYINWCETIPPYVSIGISNLLDSREVFSIPHMPVVAGTNQQLPLQTITYWMKNTQMMINGFYWEGDYGLPWGGYGYADGYVESNAVTLGSNRVGGGVAPYILSTSAGLKLGLSVGINKSFTWAEASDPGALSGYNMVSSSTSVIKNGVCATGDEANRVNSWSAIGTTTSGRMIFVSSTSGSTTTAAQLCPVFQALGVLNAIRLDGGPSVAMTMSGVLLNPLTAMNSLKYGTARHIAYALKVSYPGW